MYSGIGAFDRDGTQHVPRRERVASHVLRFIFHMSPRYTRGMNTNPSPLRIGLLGFGGVVSRRHLPALKQQADTFRVTAVTRGDANRLDEAKTNSGAENAHIDWRELVRDPEVDAVLVASPNALHAEQAIAAMEAGKDVLCEKPPAINAAQAREMAETAKRTGRVLQYGFLMRFAKDVEAAKKTVDSGELGEIYHIRAWWIRRRGYPTKGSWFTTRALSGGGPLMDIGSHLLDRTLHILGYPEVEGVTSMMHARLRNTSVEKALATGTKSGVTGVCDVEDLAVCLFRLAGGVSLSLEISFAANLPETPIGTDFLGDRAGMRMQMGKEITAYGEADGDVTDSTVDIGPEKDSAEALYQRQWSHFADQVRSRGEPIPNAEQGVVLMRALEAAYVSAERGQEIHLQSLFQET